MNYKDRMKYARQTEFSLIILLPDKYMFFNNNIDLTWKRKNVILVSMLEDTAVNQEKKPKMK